MFLMAKAAEKLPIGTVYPVWTGIGAVGAVIIGIIFFNGTRHLLAPLLHHHPHPLHPQPQAPFLTAGECRHHHKSHTEFLNHP